MIFMIFFLFLTNIFFEVTQMEGEFQIDLINGSERFYKIINAFFYHQGPKE